MDTHFTEAEVRYILHAIRSISVDAELLCKKREFDPTAVDSIAVNSNEVERLIVDILCTR